MDILDRLIKLYNYKTKQLINSPENIFEKVGSLRLAVTSHHITNTLYLIFFSQFRSAKVKISPTLLTKIQNIGRIMFLV